MVEIELSPMVYSQEEGRRVANIMIEEVTVKLIDEFKIDVPESGKYKNWYIDGVTPHGFTLIEESYIQREEE